MSNFKFCLSTFFQSFLLAFIGFHQSFSLDAQVQLWTPLKDNDLEYKTVKQFRKHQLFQLNQSLFLENLTNIKNSSSRQATATIQLPLPNNKLANFDVWNAPIIAKGLNEKYPQFQSYKVIASNNPSLQGRMTWTSKGLFVHLLDAGHAYFIETISEPDIYVVYNEKDAISNSKQNLTCGHQLLPQNQPVQNFSTLHQSADLKTFRIAITATPTFTNAVGGTVEKALSSIVSSLTSLNVIFERELGIRFVLHENNEQLIFIDNKPAPFADTANAFNMWFEHGAVLDSIIGNNTYDLGHVFTADCVGGVAGLAQLTGVCSERNKARAVSCVFEGDITEFRRTFYHEIGHQLGANHTWSNCGIDANESQRHAPTAVEIGSGSTIMSYGGVCGPFNIVTNSSNFLHGINILEIQNALATDSTTCFQTIPTQNTMPEVSVRESGFTIPIGTPFELEGNAFDAENTVLTYAWEQFDTGAVSPIGAPIGSAPSFISYAPSKESVRVFPRENIIIFNNSIDTEVLPDTTRPLTFGLTVRDNHPEGGSTNFAEVSFMATAEAGPFEILSPDSAETEFAPLDSMEILWDVANTDAEPVNCQEVDVYISFDNGKTFPKKLAAKIPNNGATEVVLPDTTTRRARIKVKCADNIFFDMSNYRIRIEERIISSTQNIYDKPVRIYPNPTQNILFLELSETINQPIYLTIFNTFGRAIISQQFMATKNYFSIDTQNLPNGIYLLKGMIDEQFFTKKFIIQK